MSPPARKPAARRADSKVDAVATFLDTLRHPERALIDDVRALIAAAAPAATEQVKWNAPSFATSDDFATLNLRPKRGIQLVLHLGAKPRRDLDMRTVITAPAGLLDWKGPDRALVTIADVAQLDGMRAALGRVVKAWVRVMG